MPTDTVRAFSTLERLAILCLPEHMNNNVKRNGRKHLQARLRSQLYVVLSMPEFANDTMYDAMEKYGKFLIGLVGWQYRHTLLPEGKKPFNKLGNAHHQKTKEARKALFVLADERNIRLLDD